MDTSSAWALPLIGFVVAFLLAAITSPGGLSGAFLLMPFQVSVLGFTGPEVTPTNHLYNVVSTPVGAWRMIREGRMVWPLAGVILAGTVPGVFVGSWLRLGALAEARVFIPFMGGVLTLIGLSMVRRVMAPRPASIKGDFRVHLRRFDFVRLEYDFEGTTYGVSVPGLFLLTATVGVVGGAYGVGGGAILAPLLVAFFGLPVHTVAGATFLGTGVTSLSAVIFFVLLPLFGLPVVPVRWGLGVAMGLGGVLGISLGAALQKRLPARTIEIMLAVVVTGLGLRYAVMI